MRQDCPAGPARLRSRNAMKAGGPSSRAWPRLGAAAIRQRVHAALAPAVSKRSSTHRVACFSAANKSRRVVVRLRGFADGAVVQTTVALGRVNACSHAHRASLCVRARTSNRRSISKANWARPSAWGAPSSARPCSGAAQQISPSCAPLWAHAKAKPSVAPPSPGAAGMISVSGAQATAACSLAKPRPSTNVGGRRARLLETNIEID